MFFEYLERCNLRVSVKPTSYESLGLMHIQFKFLSLFNKLSSNHHGLIRNIAKLSANIYVPCLFRCSVPLFKARCIDIAIINKEKPFTQTIFLKSVTYSHNFISLSASSRPIIEENPNLVFLSLSISLMVETTLRILIMVFIH